MIPSLVWKPSYLWSPLLPKPYATPPQVPTSGGTFNDIEGLTSADTWEDLEKGAPRV